MFLQYLSHGLKSWSVIAIFDSVYAPFSLFYIVFLLKLIVFEYVGKSFSFILILSGKSITISMKTHVN